MSWLQKQCVVVPVDFSEESFLALDVARDFVQDPTQLHIVHVTRPWDEHAIGGAWGTETEEERFNSIRKVLHEKLSARGHGSVQIGIYIGNPAMEITQYAEEIGAELIIMPSHGRTGIQHFALGSVAERVVRIASCPVLVLRKGEPTKPKKKIIPYD